MYTTMSVAASHVVRVLPGRTGRGRGLRVVLLLLAAPSLAWADPLDPPSASGIVLASGPPPAASSGYQELSDTELDAFRGRFLECKTPPQRKRVILWDEHRSLEILGPIGTADPRNRIETSAGYAQPGRILLP